MTTSKAKPKNGFFIGVGCPGCGGALELDADFFVTTCQHCGSVIRIVQPDTPAAYLIRAKATESQTRFALDRYLKERREPLTDSRLRIKKVYYPYWRVEGAVLKLRNRIERKVYNSENDSAQATVVENPKSEITLSPYLLTIGAGRPIHPVPDSLGLRAETITILPFSSDNIQTDYEPLPVMRPWEQVQQRVRLALAALGEIDAPQFGSNYTRLFDPVFSVIYFPYLIVETYSPTCRRFALDGLTGRVVGDVLLRVSTDHESADVSGAGCDLPDAHVHFSFEPAGTSDPETDTRQFNQVTGGGADYTAMAPANDLPDDPPKLEFGELQVDFHRCATCGHDLPAQLSYVYICKNCQTLTVLGKSRFPVERIEMADCDSSQRVTLVPFWWLRLPPDDMQRHRALIGGLGAPDRIVLPAVRSNNHEALLRVAKRMTAAAQKIPLRPVETFDDRFLSVRVSLSEAIADAEMLLVRDLGALGRRGPSLAVELHPIEIGLMYVPFRLENYFYVDTIFNAVSMERQLIS